MRSAQSAQKQKRIAVGTIAALALSACASAPSSPVTGTQPKAFVTWFDDNYDPAEWYISDFAVGENHFFNVKWARDHVQVKDGILSLKITDRPSDTKGYTAGEIQRRGFYGYGRYDAIMRAAEGSGLVSAFFTHTHEQFGDPHDEIDVEILGRNPNKVEFNYFSRGIAHGPRVHASQKDTTKEFIHYTFYWTPEAIRWYADGEMVHEVTENIPEHPGRIIANIWTGKGRMSEWHGPANFASGAQAEFKCISYRSVGSNAPTCATPRYEAG